MVIFLILLKNIVKYQGQVLYGQVVPTIMIDGKAKNVTSSYDKDSADVVITTPVFWDKIGMFSALKMFACALRASAHGVCV